MILLVGLGNPGKDYKYTRHNIGFLVLDRFVKNLIEKKEYYKFSSLVVESKYRGRQIMLLKPLTFMNNSGKAVASACNFFSGKIKSILVIHDDIDINFGKIQLKKDGGTGGHKGLESIAKELGNLNFDRLRFGIGRPQGRKEAADYVLSEFKKSEISELKFNIERSVEIIEDYILNGLEYSMNKYN